MEREKKMVKDKIRNTDGKMNAWLFSLQSRCGLRIILTAYNGMGISRL